MIRLSFDIELADAMAFQRHFAESDKQVRKSVNRSRYLYPAVLSIFGAIITDWDADAPTIAATLLPALFISLLWLIFMPKWFMRTAMRKARRIKSDPANAKLYGPREMIFDEEGVRVKTEDTEGSVRWSAIMQWNETPDYYFLYLSTNGAYCIPKRKVTRSEVEELRSLFTRVLSKR